jgi:hypothetical protein
LLAPHQCIGHTLNVAAVPADKTSGVRAERLAFVHHVDLLDHERHLVAIIVQYGTSMPLLCRMSLRHSTRFGTIY